MGNLHVTAINGNWFHRTIWFMVRSRAVSADKIIP